MDKDKEQAMIDENSKALMLERRWHESSMNLIRFAAAARATSADDNDGSSLNDLMIIAEENAKTLNHISREAINNMTFENSKSHIVDDICYPFYQVIRNRYILYLEPKFVDAYFSKASKNLKTMPRLDVVLEQAINEAIEKITREYDLSVDDEREEK